LLYKNSRGSRSNISEDKKDNHIVRIGCLGTIFRNKHLEKLSLWQAIKKENNEAAVFNINACASFYEEELEVDFHWVTDSIYHQEI
jgi:hypothetical protein